MTKAKLVTVNIEGVKSNSIAASEILISSDFAAIQEHWLFEFESNYLTDLCSDADMDCVIRSIDANNPIPLYQRPRGYGGVAFAWKRRFSQYVKQIPDGNERVLPVLLERYHEKVCFICAYLPCQGSYTEIEYQDSLDVLASVIQKYKDTHIIIIAADFNASLFDNRGARDRKFVKWCRDNRLEPSSCYPRSGTHMHHRGNGQSSIDYILCSDPTRVLDVTVDQCHPSNTSSHLPVGATLMIDVQSTNLSIEPTKQAPKPDWKKCDDAIYQEVVSDLLEVIPVQDDLPSLIAFCETLTDILTYAASCAIPYKTGKLKRQWDGDASRAMAAHRCAVRAWKSAGKPKYITCLFKNSRKNNVIKIAQIFKRKTHTK